MNDMASMTTYIAAAEGGIAHVDMRDHNRFLRRTPYNRGEYIRPIEVVRERSPS